MSKHGDWVIDERLPALATMYLTRREDLALKREDRGGQVDILVEILHREGDGHRSGKRMFGAQLRGARAPVTIARANKILKAALPPRGHPAEAPYPVCLLFFTMEDNAGYYTWIAEPLIRDGLARLSLAREPECRRLDRAGLDDIVRQVNEWYDVFYSTILV